MFEDTITEFKNGTRDVDDYSFCIDVYEDVYSAYIMGSGNSQCLASKHGFSCKSHIVEIFNSIGVYDILYGVG